MSDDNPYVIPEMDSTLRKQIQECNWQVVNVTTPANYFHVLRRQVGATNVAIHLFQVSLQANLFSYLFLWHFSVTQGIPQAPYCDVSKELAPS